MVRVKVVDHRPMIVLTVKPMNSITDDLMEVEVVPVVVQVVHRANQDDS